MPEKYCAALSFLPDEVSLKNLLLMFDKLFLPDIQSLIYSEREFNDPVHYGNIMSDKEIEESYEFLKHLEHLDNLTSVLPTVDFYDDWHTSFELGSLPDILKKNKLNESELVPVYNKINSSPYDTESIKRGDIIHLVINNFPIVEGDMEWSQVAEFKADDEMKHYRLGFNNWVNRAVREKYSLSEAKDELEYKLNEYERYLNTQKIKFKTSMRECWIKFPFAISEDIVKLRLEKLASEFFFIQKIRSNYAESISNAPCREVAYISAIRNAVKG